jgi:aminoglycoside phosphotransferase (APT) family kinase protein
MIRCVVHTFNDLCSRLETFLTRELRSPVCVKSLRQLAGGASRESWSVEIETPERGAHRGASLVLRRDMGGVIHDEALSREQEFRVIAAAHAAGVLVPAPRHVCGDAAVLDAPFFLMDRLEGESVGRRIVRQPELADARRRLPRQMGEQLARIHSVDVHGEQLDFLPQSLPGRSPAESALDRALRQLWRLGEPHPALELGARWLQSHAPACDRPVLVHGDFRIGNLMVGPDGLVGVLDWEFAHVGDPAEDLAWPCVRSWRFGADERRLGGIGDPAEFFDAYERAGGRSVDSHAVAFWEILGNFRWAVGCVAQAHRHLSGQAPSIELASLGRRTAEMELELLRLIDSQGASLHGED